MIIIATDCIFPLTAKASRKDHDDFDNELKLMKKLKPHQHVVQLLGCCTKEGRNSFSAFFLIPYT